MPLKYLVIRRIGVIGFFYRHGGVMVKASALRAEDRGSIPSRIISKTLKMEF